MSNGFNEIIDINQINNELNAINTHLEMFMYTIIGIATVGIFFGIVVSVLLCKIKNNAEKNNDKMVNLLSYYKLDEIQTKEKFNISSHSIQIE